MTELELHRRLHQAGMGRWHLERVLTRAIRYASDDLLIRAFEAAGNADEWKVSQSCSEVSHVSGACWRHTGPGLTFRMVPGSVASDMPAVAVTKLAYTAELRLFIARNPAP